MTRGRALIVAGLLASGGAVTVAILPTSNVPSTTAEIASPVVLGGDIRPAHQLFRVHWSAFADDQGAARITGYIDNDQNRPAEHVTLRIDRLDGTGQVIATALRPVDDVIPGLDRSYFDVQVSGRAAAYHVAVNSFAFVEGEN